MIRITAIIVNYYTASLLPQLIAEDLLSEPLVTQIIVIDNSQELSQHTFGFESYENVIVVVNEMNRGFGAAVNQAVESAVGDWILLINPDVKMAQGSIRTLLDAALQYQSPLVGPRFYWDDDYLFKLPPSTGSCFWFETANTFARHTRLDAELLSFYWMLRHERFWTAKEPFYEPFLAGACLLIDRDWIASLGGKLFDERFFLYFEDTDLCVQAVSHNIRPLCVPAALVVHYYNQSPSGEFSKSSYMEESRQRFWAKYYDTVSMPEFEGTSYSYPLSDLGVQAATPAFAIPEPGLQEKVFVEMGINPYFVPFGQASALGKTFFFPQAIWHRLTPGQYYTRIRGDISGTKIVWKWEKK